MFSKDRRTFKDLLGAKSVFRVFFKLNRLSIDSRRIIGPLQNQDLLQTFQRPNTIYWSITVRRFCVLVIYKPRTLSFIDRRFRPMPLTALLWTQYLLWALYRHNIFYGPKTLLIFAMVRLPFKSFLQMEGYLKVFQIGNFKGIHKSNCKDLLQTDYHVKAFYRLESFKRLSSDKRSCKNLTEREELV